MDGIGVSGRLLTELGGFLAFRVGYCGGMNINASSLVTALVIAFVAVVVYVVLFQG